MDLGVYLANATTPSSANTSLPFATNRSVEVELVSLDTAIPIGLAILLMMLITGIGNLLVLVAVNKDSKLQTLSNKLVASLAVTDMLVGFLVLPFAALNSILAYWPFDTAICDLFITIDVSLCTNSILHLMVIAIDRYWTATDITYRKGNRKYEHVFCVGIPLTWLWSLAVVLPPLIGGLNANRAKDQCDISQNKGYTIYSTMGAFYIPLVAIIIIYTNVFSAVKATAHKNKFKQRGKRDPTTKEQKKRLLDKSTPATPTTEKNVEISPGGSLQLSKTDSRQEMEVHLINGKAISETSQKQHKKSSFKGLPRDTNSSAARQRKLAQKHERRAFRTLLIITGIFVTCWLPFFIFAILMPFCGEKCSSDATEHVQHVVTWLGYSNSMLNPIIYTIFNRDFRSAFKDILNGCSKKQQ